MGKGPFPTLHNISQRLADFRSIWKQVIRKKARRQTTRTARVDTAQNPNRRRP